MVINILVLVASLLVVVKSADLFLGSAEKIGVALRLSPFILGVLLVGFGTSLPELATSISAVIGDVHQVTIANIVGSNITNILVIIGISTFFLGTIKFDKELIDLDLPLLLTITVLFGLLIIDGQLNMTDGVILLFGFIGYIIYAVTYREVGPYHKGLVSLIKDLSNKSNRQLREKRHMPEASTIFVALGSIIALAAASHFTIGSLLAIVREINVGVGVLTYFTIAIGTSLPEFIVAFKAIKKGQGDLVLGNIIGSCIFNILLIGGVASFLAPQTMEPNLLLWSLVGISVSAVFLVVSGITRRIHAWEGLMFLLVYVAISIQILT